MNPNKKSILFVINNMRVGGAEKSLISLLQTIDYSLYDVSLQLFTNDGLFLKQVHTSTTILPAIDNYKYYDMSIVQAIKQLVLKGRLDIAFNRLVAGYIFKTEKNSSRCEQRVWKYISKGIAKSTIKYDAVFAFLEKMPIYYAIEKINATKKIGFIHNDYEKLAMDKNIDTFYFEKLDAIITDSQECKAVLIKNFPQFSSKFKIIYNIVSPSLINKLAQEKIESLPTGLKIVSIGRLDVQKGYDLAIDALKIVKHAGYKFTWIILGEGAEKQRMVNQIIANDLVNEIVFLGIKENHYPYVLQAAIFMQTSRFEGKSIAIDEAKILQKPILVTNFSTVNDQISNEITGIIAEMNPQAIAEKLILLIENTSLRTTLSTNLSKEKLGTESEIEKIYELVL